MKKKQTRPKPPRATEYADGRVMGQWQEISPEAFERYLADLRTYVDQNSLGRRKAR